MIKTRVQSQCGAYAGWRASVFAFLLLMLSVGPAAAQARGYLLYNQNCVECHTAEVHWRDKRLATDWKSLNMQVRRWQKVVDLEWNEEDVLNVTRYLNTRYYDFWPPSDVKVVPATSPRMAGRTTEVNR